MPSTRVATTLRPLAIASIGASAAPSYADGSTTTLAAASQRGTSVRTPTKRTPSSDLARARSSASSGPSPTSTSWAPGTRAVTLGQARSSRC